MRDETIDYEDAITEEVLQHHPDATGWKAETTEYENGFFFDDVLDVTTPAGVVQLDVPNCETDLTELANLLGPLGRDSTHSVSIPDGWKPTPPEPKPAHVVKLFNTYGHSLELSIDAIDASGVTSGDLAHSSGRLYLMVDGVDLGALWIHRPTPDSPVTISMVTPDDEAEWVPAHTLPE